MAVIDIWIFFLEITFWKGVSFFKEEEFIFQWRCFILKWGGMNAPSALMGGFKKNHEVVGREKFLLVKQVKCFNLKNTENVDKKYSNTWLKNGY